MGVQVPPSAQNGDCGAKPQSLRFVCPHERERRGEPSPELLYVLRSYVKRANERWVPYRENVLKNRDEEQRILKALKDAR